MLAATLSIFPLVDMVEVFQAARDRQSNSPSAGLGTYLWSLELKSQTGCFSHDLFFVECSRKSATTRSNFKLCVSAIQIRLPGIHPASSIVGGWCWHEAASTHTPEDLASLLLALWHAKSYSFEEPWTKQPRLSSTVQEMQDDLQQSTGAMAMLAEALKLADMADPGECHLTVAAI